MAQILERVLPAKIQDDEPATDDDDSTTEDAADDDHAGWSPARRRRDILRSDGVGACAPRVASAGATKTVAR